MYKQDYPYKEKKEKKEKKETPFTPNVFTKICPKGHSICVCKGEPLLPRLL